MKGPGGKPATSATLAIANDAETAVPVRVSVRRVVRKPANAAVP